MSKPKTLFEKVWDAHTVVHPEGEPAALYIDLHLVHEVTSPQAFEGLRAARRKVRRPELTAADRCDRCGAAAQVRAVLPSGGELLFCGHHARKHNQRLVDS